MSRYERKIWYCVTCNVRISGSNVRYRGGRWHKSCWDQYDIAQQELMTRLLHADIEAKILEFDGNASNDR